MSSHARPSRFYLLFIPLLLLTEAIALGWASRLSRSPLFESVTPLSLVIAGLILITGLFPALTRPSITHTLIACFSILFASLLVIPLNFSQLPIIQPGIPLVELIAPTLSLRLVNGVMVLALAIHVSSRFPANNPRVSNRTILTGYVSSATLLLLILLIPSPWIRIPVAVLLVIWLVTAVSVSFWSLLRAARDTSSDGMHYAQQARIVFFSIALAEFPLFVRILGLLFKTEFIPYDIVLVSQLFIPVGITYAVLRHDLFGIDRVIRRTLTYGALSLLLLTLYFAITNALTTLLRGFFSISHPFTPVIGLLIAAAFFEPSRRITQQWLDRLLYPDRLKFQKALQEMQTSLTSVNHREEIVSLLTINLPQQIGAGWAAVTLFPAPDVPPVGYGTPAWNTRLVAGNVVFGSYWLGARKAGPHYDTEERVRLQALLGQASLAMAYAKTYESLYELNRDLETRVKEQTAQALEDQRAITTYQERQRLARDLHDSVTQSLFGLHLTARALKASAPEAMKGDLSELEKLAGNILREMRLLLEQLRNPASRGETLNITEAVRSQCEALTQRTGPEGGPLLSVALDMSEEIIIPATIGNEILWIVREALQNIVRHSESRNAKISLLADHQLRLVIEDDGKGFDSSKFADGHYGVRGMRERTLALGGEFKIESQIGNGTILAFQFPLAG